MIDITYDQQYYHMLCMDELLRINNPNYVRIINWNRPIKYLFPIDWNGDRI